MGDHEEGHGMHFGGKGKRSLQVLELSWDVLVFSFFSLPHSSMECVMEAAIGRSSCARSCKHQMHLRTVFLFLIFYQLNAVQLPPACPYNLSSLDFAPAVDACSEQSNAKCCKHIAALVGVAASQYANSSGLLSLPKQWGNLCLNAITASLEANGIPSDVSRFCRVRHNINGSLLCKNLETVQDVLNAADFKEVLANCAGEQVLDASQCGKCLHASRKFASRLSSPQGPNPSGACNDAVFVALASFGDSHYAMDKANCIFDLRSHQQTYCPFELNSWQVENVANVCKDASANSYSCCSMSLLTLRIAAAEVVNASGAFFMSRKQARTCINDLGTRIRGHQVSATSHEKCGISSDSIFSDATRGCNKISTVDGLEHKLLRRSIDVSHVAKSCKDPHSCAACRRAVLDATYAAAWPYFDVHTMQSCMDLVFLMLASNRSITKRTEIGGCLYSLPVLAPVEDLGVVLSPALPPSQEYESETVIPLPLMRVTHQASTITLVLAIGIGITGTALALLLFLRKREELGKLSSFKQMNHWRKDSSLFFRRFKYNEIQQATNSFSSVIGKGGCVTVYKAIFKDGLVAAVKRLQQMPSRQADTEVPKEIEVSGRVHHRHLVSLRGFCGRRHERFLVYDYMENGSLKEHLHDHTRTALKWQTRLQIAIGVATALEYLHCYCEPPIYHGDIKSSSIMLDRDLVAKVADVGLAHNMTWYAATDVWDTAGYGDPKRISTHAFTEESDVYSYGVLLLELITARQAVNLVEWVAAGDSKMVDPRLGGAFDVEELRNLVVVARLCTRSEGTLRPSMKQVLSLLCERWDDKSAAAAFPPLSFSSSDDTSASVHSATSIPFPSMTQGPRFIFDNSPSMSAVSYKSDDG